MQTEVPESPAEPTATASRLQRARRWMPWISLAMGLRSAAWTEHHPRRAGLICAIAAAAWLLMFVWHHLRKRAEAAADAEGRASRWLAIGTFSTDAAAQSAVQALLWFSLPWIWRASVPTGPQIAYLLLLGLVAGSTLWDPLWARLVARRTVAALLFAAATFAGLAATLPMLGVPLATAPWIAAAAATVPAAVHVLGQGAWREIGRWSLVQVAVVPWWLLAGPLRPAVPAAPLSVRGATFAAAIEQRMPVGSVDLARPPSRVHCYSPVILPAGLGAEVVHRWTVDDAPLIRHPLLVQGGRVGGFRTWTRHPGGQLKGKARLRCRIETAAGQPLADVELEAGR